MGLELHLYPLKQLVFILLCLYLKCAKFEFKIFDATKDEMRLMPLYQNPDVIR